jgi:hypothetical protein
MRSLSYYYHFIEGNYELAKKYYLLLLLKIETKINTNANTNVNTKPNANVNIDNDFKWFYNIFKEKIINTMDLARLFINDVCELFNVENNNLELIKIKVFIQCIFNYLNNEYDYEQLPENMNIFLLYTGKILNKCKKKSSNTRKIINPEIKNLKKNGELMEKKINKLTKNKKFSKLIIKKYFKEIYEEYQEN